MISADRSWSRSSDSSASAFFSTKTAGPIGISIKKHLISKRSTVILCDFLKFQQKMEMMEHVYLNVDTSYFTWTQGEFGNIPCISKIERSVYDVISLVSGRRHRPCFSKNHPKVFLGSRFFLNENNFKSHIIPSDNPWQDICPNPKFFFFRVYVLFCSGV